MCGVVRNIEQMRTDRARGAPHHARPQHVRGLGKDTRGSKKKDATSRLWVWRYTPPIAVVGWSRWAFGPPKAI